MSLTLELLLLALFILLSGLFSGSETGLYAVSRVRVELDARQGLGVAQRMRWLFRDELALLITLLVGTNLANQLATYQGESLARRMGAPEGTIELVVTLILGPLIFLFGEVLPKELYRRRPLALLGWTAPFVIVARWLFWPLERILWLLSSLLARALGTKPELLSEVRGREAVVRLLAESTQTGNLEPHAEQLARNVLRLRTTRVVDCCVPWDQVVSLDASASPEEQRAAVGESPHTRLPVIGAEGAVRGYVHQLDALGAGPGTPVLDAMHKAVAVPPELSVDRALARLAHAGQRWAVVGTLEAPVGLISLKDLVEEISGELADW